MFDEQEQKLLSQALGRARKDYRNHSNVYQVSAFDETFDSELKKLVIYYSFDFEAIALHLYFKFPQYAFRMKPQAVSYRWYQLSLQEEGTRIKQEILGSIEKDEKQLIEESQMMEQDEINTEEIEEEVVLFNLQEKKQHYEAALRMASCLDEEEEESFMVYRPKFIVDSEFKLQRLRSQDTMILSALVDNELNFEFGSFSAPQAAPINLPIPLQPAAPAPPDSPPVEEEQYMDDDWQAYQSD